MSNNAILYDRNASHPASTTTSIPVLASHSPGTIEASEHLPNIVTISFVPVICLMITPVIVAKTVMKYCWRSRREDLEQAVIASQADSPEPTTEPAVSALDTIPLGELSGLIPNQANSFMATLSSGISHASPSSQEHTEGEINSPETANQHPYTGPQVSSIGDGGDSSFCPETCRNSLVKSATPYPPGIVQEQLLQELLMAPNPNPAATSQSTLGPASSSSSVRPTLQDTDGESKSPIWRVNAEDEHIADQDVPNNQTVDAVNDRIHHATCNNDPASDELFLSVTDIKVGKDAISKAVSLARIIRTSPTLHSKLQSENTSDLSQLFNLTLVRWHSIASGIGALCSIRESLGQICDIDCRKEVPQLFDAYPTEPEWEFLQQLSSLLELFDKRALVPDMETPSVCDISFMFGCFKSELESFMIDDSNYPSLRAAAKRGLAMVQSSTNPSRISGLVRVATLLDPRAMIKGLREDGWTEHDIEQILVLFQTIWEQDYEPTPK